MPYPGTANNPEGVNGYEDLTKEKILTRAVPVAAPGVGAPRQAQRRAVKAGRRAAPASASAQPHPSAGQTATGEVQAQTFWQAVLADPESSPLAKEYAHEALGG